MSAFLRSLSFAIAILLAASGGKVMAAAEADLLVAFDNSYFDGVGGIDNAEVATANSVAASNWINDVSGTGARMRICGYHATYGQAGRSSLGGFVGWMGAYGDGYLDDVTAAADAAGADLVAFICAPAAGEGSAAVAYQPGRYAAYQTGSFWNNVVAHESGGHNYGCDHRGCRENPKTILMHNYCGGGSQAFYSNPNIWLNGAKLLGEGSCLGAAVNGGDNSYLISTTAQGVEDRNGRVVYGSNLYPVVRRWQFNKPAAAAPASTVVADSIAGAPATVRGQGAIFTGTGLKLPGGTTGNAAADSIAAYIDLPNGLFSGMPSFTIEIWATPLTASNWMRIIDIGRTVEAGDGLGAAGEYTGTPGSAAPGATSASDCIELTAATGSASLANQRFLAGVDGTLQIADSNLATAAGEMHHYAITFKDTTASGAGGTVKWFRDGALIKELNVTFDSASLEDVNNWLGRSLWSGDTMANIEFHDVRIIGAALADGHIAGNYRIGPQDAKSTMWANDAYNNSGFVNGAWEFGGTPVATRDYEVGTMLLRSPRNANNVTFPGKSLGITGGNLNLDATGTRTVTVNDLRLNGGATIGAYTSAGTQTLAGTINVKNNSDNLVRGWTPLVITASISGAVGGGGMHYVHDGVTLAGNNVGYLGATIVGDGRFSTLKISSETNLGGNPAFYGGGWLQLNRGILETTATMAIDDPNRGVLIGPSGGFFRPAAGTTLTIASTLNSPAAGNTLQIAPMDSNPIQGMFFKDGAGTLVLTNPNNSHNAEMLILQGELRIDGGGRLNNGDHWMPITLNSTLNYNSTATQTLRGAMSGNGTLVKNNTGTLNLNGANTFSGSVTVNSGTLVANPGNAATNRAFSYVSGIVINNGATLRSGVNGLFGWDGTQTKPITVNAGGTLTTIATGTDVNVGTITLNGGTLAGNASAAWGSWNLKRVNGAKLNVTENSTVSAPNVGLGTNNSIEIAAGKTLTFSGAITDLTSEGVTSVVKSGGTGTLTLSAANTYTGVTTISAGTLNLTGSLAAGSVVSIASGATLTGPGTVNGVLNIAANAIHAPGNVVGTQTVIGALTYTAGARIKWNLLTNSDAAGAASRVAAGTVTAAGTIDLDLNRAGSTVSFLDTFWMASRSWPVVSSSGMSGSFSLGTITSDSAGRSASSYGTFSLVQGASGAVLQWTPKPFHKWRGNSFGASAGNDAMAGFFVDADKDSSVNGLEFFNSSNPTTASATPMAATIENGRAVLRFTRNSEATDVTAAIQGADAITGPWQDLARSLSGAPFSAVAPNVTVSETGSGTLRTVEFKDAFLTTDPAHRSRVFRLSVTPE